MNQDSTPSQHDYTRLRRALVGVMLILLALIIAGFAIEFTRSDLVLVDGLFCLLYCSLPIVALVALFRCRLTPQNDPTYERFVRGSRLGRRLSLCFGAGCLGAGILSFLLTDREFRPDLLWFAVSGLAFLFWSFQFPKPGSWGRSIVRRDKETGHGACEKAECPLCSPQRPDPARHEDDSMRRPGDLGTRHEDQ